MNKSDDISAQNRWLLRVLEQNLKDVRQSVHQPSLIFKRYREFSDRFLLRIKKKVHYLLLRNLETVPAGSSWPLAMGVIALVRSSETGSAASSAMLTEFFDARVDAEGQWRSPIVSSPQIMQGYALCSLFVQRPEERYKMALFKLFDFLETHKKMSNGCLPYTQTSEELFVDSLGIICPFLAAFGKVFANQRSVEVALHQIDCFLARNVDEVSRLPYHAYYADGFARLGLQGWGRGTGWYMIGLIDTMLELPADHVAIPRLRDAFVSAAATLRSRQRSDGHWTWSILSRSGPADSSATSFIGYALMRAISGGVLDEDYLDVVMRAVSALMRVTRPDGRVTGSSGEAKGLGDYVGFYGPQPWLQASTASLGLLTQSFRDRPS
jgi:rhamnogalacturonyl hydrolase YesR